MNLCFLTIQIATWPRKYKSKRSKEFTHFLVRIPNPKKGKSFYYINASARSEIGKNLFDWYSKGDYLVIEGNLLIKANSRNKYIVELNIIKESPLVLEI
jgi:hypothetical protein